MGIKNVLSVWKDVFSNWKYSLAAIFIMLIFYSINVLIPNFSAVISYYQKLGLFGGSEFFFNLFFGFRETVQLSSFISIISISILFGLLFSLIAYKTNILRNTTENSGKMGFFGTTGIFLGILAPGCAACGVGLLSIMGLSAATLTFLPFDGLELSFLAIGILGFSVIKISKDIKKGIVCEI